ncbi:MAG: NosD domain-containing protein [Candidatus Micrarchaeia archaeon]
MADTVNYGTDQPGQAVNAVNAASIPSQQPAQGGASIAFSKVLIGIVIIILIAIAFLTIRFFPTPQKVVTTTSTIPAPKNVYDITNCTVIDAPGRYYVIHNIFSKIRKGACLLVNSSNVFLSGDGNEVRGTGPYAVVPPYTFGIELGSVSNVSVTDISLDDFSYGVYANHSSNSRLWQINATNDTMSGVFLFDSFNISLANSILGKTSSHEGGLYISGGGKNRIINVSLLTNLFVGAVINSSGNIFDKDYFANNPVDIYCKSVFGFVKSNMFSNSTCNTNDYCSFASCRKVNIPTNLSAIELLPGNITQCGGILFAGNYVIAKNLNLSNFLNTSNPLALAEPCISLEANFTNVSCRNSAIMDSGIGLSINHQLHDAVSNCKFVNDIYGIKAANSYALNISKVSVNNSGTGIYLYNVTGGSIEDIKTMHSLVGLYSNDTIGLMFNNITSLNNSYGVYFDSGSSDAFNSGNLSQNYKVDFYCSPYSYNSSANLFQNINCGLTDCTWAHCKSFVEPQLSAYPLSSCQQITRPGNYSLSQSIITKGNCFLISANDVTFNCNSKLVKGPGMGYAFAIENASGITLNNCNINGFGTGISLDNVRNVALSNLNISNVGYGVAGNDVAMSAITSVSTSLFSLYGFSFTNLSNSTLMSDRATGGIDSATGFYFNNSFNNTIGFNLAEMNPGYGFMLSNFINNTFYNNSAFSNRLLDYSCSPDSSGLYSDLNGVNSGNTKNACRWLLVLPRISSNPPCAGIYSSSTLSFSSDMVYSYGGICYNIYNTQGSSANYTTINCNGHTILATKGGTFVNVVNASNVKLENCFIKNFTHGIVSYGAYTRVMNNTFGSVSVGVALYGANSSYIENNRFVNDSIGVYGNSTSLSKVFNNTFSKVNTGIIWQLGTATQIYSNIANRGDFGIVFENATLDSVKNDSLTNMSRGGIACYGISQSQKSANQDFGGMVCSSNLNCTWISSPTCK